MQRCQEHERERHGDPDGDQETLARERRVPKDVPGRHVGALRDEPARERAERPAHSGAGQRDEHRLGSEQSRELPPARPVPSQAQPRRIHVPSHAHGREDREREEERSRLASDEEQPAGRDLALFPGFPKLDDGRREREPGRSGLEGRAGAGNRAGETTHIPGADAPGAQWHHPGIAPVDVLELGRASELVDAVREHQGCGRWPMVGSGLPEGRADCGARALVLDRGDEVPEEHG